MKKNTLFKTISCLLITFFLSFVAIGSTFASVTEAKPHNSNETSASSVTHQQEWNAVTTLMALNAQNVTDSVQVFDVQQGHVIKTVNNSNKIQKHVKRILKQVYEFAPEVQPDMKAKYIIRLPVKKGTTVKLSNNTIAINELFIFYYVDKEPLLLVFDENKKPYLFHTKQSIDPLLNVIQVE